MHSVKFFVLMIKAKKSLSNRLVRNH